MAYLNHNLTKVMGMRSVVSVIIPTKNRAQYLRLAIESVLSQSFQDFELLVVDASSTDSTQRIVGSYKDNRICYIKEQKDRGPSASRNTGIKKSKGKFIAFLDDDDLWMPAKLEKQLEVFAKDQSVGVVYTGYREFTDDGKLLGYGIPSVKGRVFPAILRKNLIGNCSTVLAKRQCLDQAGLFDERLNAIEDYDLWVRLAMYCQFDYVKEPLVLYRLHKRRNTMNYSRLMKAQEVLHQKYFNEIMMLTDARRIFARGHYNHGKTCCASGDMSRGRKEFIKAISNDPFNIAYYSTLLLSFLGVTTYRSMRSFQFFIIPASFRFKIE